MVFSGLGAALTMIVGAVSTIDAIGIYFGSEKQEEFSEDAALKTTTTLVSSLDEFLLGLVLFIFAYGVFRLFIVDKRHGEEVPDWFSVHSVTDLKVKLLETIAVLLAVVFSKAVLGTEPGSQFVWTEIGTLEQALPLQIARRPGGSRPRVPSRVRQGVVRIVPAANVFVGCQRRVNTDPLSTERLGVKIQSPLTPGAHHSQSFGNAWCQRRGENQR